MKSPFDPDWGPGNYTDRAGASALKERIENYWRERGHSVEVQLVEAPFTPAVRAARFDLRSEMINGLPRGWKVLA
ncbi:MAG TPA: hypothetical protein VG841_15145 [Caulobacterales bacterium]|nr:hypothetical protein [Caulobacterales bacterium]